MTDTTEQLVVKLQTLFRARQARRKAVELANEAYLKCWDTVTGLAYYCNLRTGLSSWKKPLFFAIQDPVLTQTDSDLALDERMETKHVEINHNGERFQDSLNFKKQCEDAKQDLQRRHRKKIAYAMRRFEKRMLDEKKRCRNERLTKLKVTNQQDLHEFYDGKKRENVQTIRQAALQGNLDRLEKLLEIGFSADAESAMGLTPLLAACQSGHLEIVRRLLSSGAKVNHRHIVTGRTALMEAASRPTPLVLKELLRYGAQIYVEDGQGETVFDCIKNAENQDILERACKVWSSDNAGLFPTEFRSVLLTYVLISKRQREVYEAKLIATRKELIQLKQTLQRACVEAKVRYDQVIRNRDFEPTLLHRLSLMEAADFRYDDERRVLLLEIQNALDRLHDSERPCFIPLIAVQTIMSFCSRHWFDIDPQRQTTKKNCGRINSSHQILSTIVPTSVRPSPDELPEILQMEWKSFQQALQQLCDELRETKHKERFDSVNGVSIDVNGNSLATLNVFVENGENLAFRNPRIGEMIDAYVRIFLRLPPTLGNTKIIESSVIFADRNPAWKFHCQFTSVPSIWSELLVEVVDQKRQELAGQVVIPLRSLLDQKDHDEWHIMAPTLRQQLLETKPRDHPARLRICVQLTHTKSILLTRKLQQFLRHRELLVKKRRDAIQFAIDTRLHQLP